MQIEKQKSEFGVKIILKEYNKSLTFSFEGNGDLYWTYRSSNVNKDNHFIINKENSGVYDLFKQLFCDIDNINIYDEEDISCFIDIEEQKKKYRLYNQAHYHEL